MGHSILFPVLFLSVFFFFFKIFIYLLLERGEGERGREGEKHQCVVASHAPPTGGLAHNPVTYPRLPMTL